MIKKSLTIFLLFAFTIQCFSQDMSDPFDLGSKIYRDKNVKSITKIKTDKYGNTEKLIRTKYDEHGSETEYNSFDGKKIKFNVVYNKDASISYQETVGYRESLIFSKNEKLLRNGKIESIEYYLPIPYMEELMENYHYDEKGRLDRIVGKIKKPNKDLYCHKYYYNNKDKISSIITYQIIENDTSVFYTKKYKYHPNENIFEVITLSTDDVEIAKQEYNENGQIIVHSRLYGYFSYSDIFYFKETFSYFIDNVNNPLAPLMFIFNIENRKEWGKAHIEVFSNMKNYEKYTYNRENILSKFEYWNYNETVVAGEVSFLYNKNGVMNKSIDSTSFIKGRDTITDVVISTYDKGKLVKSEFQKSKSYLENSNPDSLSIVFYGVQFSEKIIHKFNKKDNTVIRKTYEFKNGKYLVKPNSISTAYFDENKFLVEEKKEILNNDEYILSSIKKIERLKNGKTKREMIDNSIFWEYEYDKKNKTNKIVRFESDKYITPIFELLYTYNDDGGYVVSENWIVEKYKSRYEEPSTKTYNTSGMLILNEEGTEPKIRKLIYTYSDNNLLDNLKIEYLNKNYSYQNSTIDFRYTFY